MTALADVRHPSPYSGDPVPQPASGDHHRLQVKVVFTTLAGTMAALQTAQRLVRGLNAEIVLIVAEVVYFRYPIDHPPVPARFFERLCLAIVQELQIDASTVGVDIRLCRDQAKCLEYALNPRSIVVIGMGKGLRSWRERSLPRALRRLGHDVVLVPPESGSDAACSQSAIQRILSDVTAHADLL